MAQATQPAAAHQGATPAAHDQSGALEEAYRQGPFLAIISQGIPLHAAVRDAGITKTIHRQWLASDPDYAAAFQQAYEGSAELRARVISEMRSRASEARWEDPDARAKMREHHREYWTPERREEFAQQMRERFEEIHRRREQLLAAARAWWDRPDSRAINSERMKRLWADPEYRQRYQAAIDNPERRERLSDAAKAQWAALTREERDAKLRHMRRAFKGGQQAHVA